MGTTEIEDYIPPARGWGIALGRLRPKPEAEPEREAGAEVVDPDDEQAAD
jgi:hypothetical protein